MTFFCYEQTVEVLKIYEYNNIHLAFMIIIENLCIFCSTNCDNKRMVYQW